MSTSSIVICPPAPGESRVFDHDGLGVELTSVAQTLAANVLTVPAVDYLETDDLRTQRAHWVAALAVAMSAAQLTTPIALVLVGAAGALAPAVGFSQRAARRSVSGYLMVDADVPTIGGAHEDWPDAPVSYLYSPTAHALTVNQARLRGWHVVSMTDAGPCTVTDAIAAVVPTLL